MHTLLPAIIRDAYGVPNEEVYGVALNGMTRVFLKLNRASVYDRLVEEYQERKVTVNSAVDVVMHDVSRNYTWVKVRNVPFEATAYSIQEVFNNYGKVHSATMEVWTEGPYKGRPEGSYTLKMTLARPIPSYVMLVESRTQVFVHYAGQRKTCRLCSSYDHMAAQCPRRQPTRAPGTLAVEQRPCELMPELGEEEAVTSGRWSEEVEREVSTVGTCVTLLEVTGEGPPSPEGRVDVEESTQEKLLEAVLQEFFDEKVAGEDGPGLRLALLPH